MSGLKVYQCQSILFICFLLCCKSSYAQNRTSVYLITEEGDNIQFAYTYLDQDSLGGIFSDIDGKISLDIKDKAVMSVSHPDYHTQSFDLSQKDSLVFILNQVQTVGVQNLGLKLVDPAIQIVEEVIANERLHDPERQGGSFRYKTYAKTLVDLYELAEHRLKPKYKDIVKKDSLFHKHHKFYGQQHVEVIESMTERTFQYPKKDHEKVMGMKVTGLHEDEITPMSSNLHPISFYGNYFEFLGVRYASPVGVANYKKYDFQLVAKRIVDKDTIYTISFKPSHLRFPGLIGKMDVNSNQYAIQHITVEPEHVLSADFQISYQYKFVENREWFPMQINYIYSVDKFPKPYLGTVYNKKTYIKDLELDPDLNEAKKKIELFVLDHYATKKEEEFWSTHRLIPLTKRERLTYLRVDTLRHQSTSANIIKRVAAFYNEDLNYRLPPVIIFKNVFNIGRYEGARLGLGADLGKGIFKVFELNGYGAYGFRDAEWKYGYGGTFFLNKTHDAELQFEHQKDIREPGNVVYLNKEKDFFRSIFIGTMDSYESNHVKLSFRTPGYHQLELGLHDYIEIPLYDYTHMEDDGSISNSFNVTEFTLRSRFATKERITHTLGKVNRLKTSYPVLHINYNKGLSTLGDGNYEFNKISAALDFKVYFGSAGITDIAIEAGNVEQDLPYPLLFNGRGGNLATSSVIIEDHFQTMNLYEFASNRFINVFYSHNFGSSIFGGAKFRPDIILYHHMGWGHLDDPTRHQSSEVLVQGYEKGFVESGIGFQNIIRYKFFGKFYGGLGLGFFHRYGALKNQGGFGQNFATRLTYVIRGI